MAAKRHGKPVAANAPPEWVLENWPGSATILAVRSKGTRDGTPVDESRYDLTSLCSGAKALLGWPEPAQAWSSASLQISPQYGMHCSVSLLLDSRQLLNHFDGR